MSVAGVRVVEFGPKAAAYLNTTIIEVASCLALGNTPSTTVRRSSHASTIDVCQHPSVTADHFIRQHPVTINEVGYCVVLCTVRLQGDVYVRNDWWEVP